MPVTIKKLCSVDDCGNEVKARGYCNKHYQRWKKHGDPTKIVLVQYNTPEDRWDAWTEWQGECLIWTGYLDNYGYGRIQVDGAGRKAHRYAWEREYGPIPEGMLIDHKDHCNTACVNVKHLRLATHAQNNANRGNLRSDNTSGHRNVFWDKERNKWRVEVGGTYIGRYSSLEDAIEVEEQARKELFGEFAGKG